MKIPPDNQAKAAVIEADNRFYIKQERLKPAMDAMVSMLSMQTVQAIEGEKTNPEMLATLHYPDGKSLLRGNAGDTYDQQLSVGVLRFVGVSWARVPEYYEYYGWIDPFRFAARVLELARDNTVHSIVLEVHSPGGTVAGTEVAALAVREAASIKPVIAVVNDMACSAAYWVASQATEVVLANDTSMVGSIGVIMTHVDYTKWAEEMGFTVTYIRSTEKKARGQPYESMNEDIRQEWQDEADLLHKKFSSGVLAGRSGKLKKENIANVATGETWYGRDAISQGLADRIASLSKVISDQLKDIQTSGGTKSRAETPARAEGASMQEKEDPDPDGTASGSTPTTAQSTPLTLEALTQSSPDLLASIQSEAGQAAVTAEQTRIAGLLGLTEGQALSDQTLTTLAREAQEGRDYRAALVASLRTEAVRLYGAEAGLEQGNLLAEAFAHVSIDKLAKQVQTLQSLAEASLPAGRLSTEKTEQGNRPIDWDKEA